MEQSLYLFLVWIGWEDILVGDGYQWRKYRSWMGGVIHRRESDVGIFVHALWMCRRLTDLLAPPFPFPALHILMVTMIISMKFVDGGESFLIRRLSSYFKCLRGFPHVYIAQIELWFLTNIHWRLFVDAEEYESVHRSLYNFAHLSFAKDDVKRSRDVLTSLETDTCLLGIHVFISMAPISPAFDAHAFLQDVLDSHSIHLLAHVASLFSESIVVDFDFTFQMLLNSAPCGVIRIEAISGCIIFCRPSKLPRRMSIRTFISYLRCPQVPLVIFVGKDCACPCSAWVPGEGRWKPFQTVPKQQRRTLSIRGEWHLQFAGVFSH